MLCLLFPPPLLCTNLRVYSNKTARTWTHGRFCAASSLKSFRNNGYALSLVALEPGRKWQEDDVTLPAVTLKHVSCDCLRRQVYMKPPTSSSVP